MKFILSIDTEADNQWDHGRELSVENLKYIPRLQALCNRFGIKPTYLVTSEVCYDDYARSLFSDLIKHDTAEIGAHLHCWTTPPFKDRDGFRKNDPNHAFASELPEELVEAKISGLTQEITKAFGKKPTSFRSGRYGFNDTIARILIHNGYVVDSSITPFISWAEHAGLPGGKGGPDFIKKTPFPAKIEADEGRLVEIPVTILPTLPPLNLSNAIAGYYFSHVDKSFILKIFRKLFYSNQPLWLRPFPWMNTAKYHHLIKQGSKIKLPFLVMMFHSSELMPGGSKYRPDEKSIESLFLELESLFRLLEKQNIEGISLTEAAHLFQSDHPLMVSNDTGKPTI